MTSQSLRSQRRASLQSQAPWVSPASQGGGARVWCSPLALKPCFLPVQAPCPDILATKEKLPCCIPPKAHWALPLSLAAASRVVMGGVCDRWGPRHGAAALLLLTASATFGEGPHPCCLPTPLPHRATLSCLSRPCWLARRQLRACAPAAPTCPAGMAAVEDAAGYLAARLFIGCSLAAFVSCQYWCSVMFTPRWGGTILAPVYGTCLKLKGCSEAFLEAASWRGQGALRAALVRGCSAGPRCSCPSGKPPGWLPHPAGSWAPPMRWQLAGATLLAALCSSSCLCC